MTSLGDLSLNSIKNLVSYTAYEVDLFEMTSIWKFIWLPKTILWRRTVGIKCALVTSENMQENSRSLYMRVKRLMVQN